MNFFVALILSFIKFSRKTLLFVPYIVLADRSAFVNENGKDVVEGRFLRSSIFGAATQRIHRIHETMLFVNLSDLDHAKSLPRALFHVDCKYQSMKLEKWKLARFLCKWIVWLFLILWTLRNDVTILRRYPSDLFLKILWKRFDFPQQCVFWSDSDSKSRYILSQDYQF